MICVELRRECAELASKDSPKLTFRTFTRHLWPFLGCVSCFRRDTSEPFWLEQSVGGRKNFPSAVFSEVSGTCGQVLHRGL